MTLDESLGLADTNNVLGGTLGDSDVDIVGVVEGKSYGESLG